MIQTADKVRKAMNVYDFDGTIYYPNCTVDLALWIMKRRPKLWFTFLPKVVADFIRCERGKLPRYVMLRRFMSILGEPDDIEKEIELFWDKHEKKIAKWYLAQKRSDDLILSASPACVIGPIARRLGVDHIATEYDPETGVFTGDLMYGKGKARYIIDRDMPLIENFYSDDLSDTPIALCAEKAHLVTDKARKVEDWPHLDADTLKTVRRKIDTGWKVHIDR